MHYIKLILIVSLCSVSLSAQSVSKSELIGNIMEAYGVEASIEATKGELLKQANGALKGILDQLRAARPDLSPKASEKINAAMEKYMNTIMSSWNGAEVVKVYSNIYEENYSLEELQRLANYVKTESGSKSIRVARSAEKAINGYIMEQMMGSMKTALQVFLGEIKVIVSQDHSEGAKK